VVLVKNEEVISASLSASQFLSLYNGLGRGGSEAVKSPTLLPLHVFGLRVQGVE